MSLFKVFDVAGSALSAQSVRLNVTASNLANADSVSSSAGQTYRARHPVFATVLDESGFADGIDDDASAGVRVAAIVESAAPLRREYWPQHPQADVDGYVTRPNVNVVEEMANMISASRSFQTNVEVMNASKQMLTRALSLGR
jgi:flagellar basal-body rod protein FlgC